MTTFEYYARDLKGAKLKDKIDALNEREAAEALGAKGLLIINLKRIESSAGSASSRLRVPLERLAPFTRQLAAMMRAGLPVMQCLEALTRQARHPAMKTVAEQLTRSLERGLSLSEALSRHPEVFSKLYISMVQAGETSGTLAELLDRLAAYLDASLRLRKKIRSAMTYPIIVSVMALAITLFLVMVIIPVFGDIFREFGHKLPLPTRVLLSVSEHIRAQLLIWLLSACAIGASIIKWRRTPAGAALWDKHKLRIPVVGQLAQYVALTRFARTLATMLRSGVSILTGCGVAGRSAGNLVLEAASVTMIHEIESGLTLTETLSRHAIFPALLQEMVSAGERTGCVGEMLEQVATYYDQEVENTLAALTALIEPLLIAFLGIVLGSVVVAMFLPIFNISQIVQF